MDNPYAAPGQVKHEGDNPYSTAGLNIHAFDEDQPYQPNIGQVNGRIGRLRWIAYSWGLMLLVGALLAGAQAVGIISNRPGDPVAAIAGFFTLIPLFIVTRRRLNDLDHSGWWLLLALIPLLNLILILYALLGGGAAGANRFGPPPERNSAGVYVVVALIVIGFLGILIPFYQGVNQVFHHVRTH